MPVRPARRALAPARPGDGDRHAPARRGNLLKRHFYPLLRRAGLPQVRFRDLRHGTATLLLACGVHPKIVSEMLGHSHVSITLDLYSHATETMQRQASDALQKLLGSNPTDDDDQAEDDEGP